MIIVRAKYLSLSVEDSFQEIIFLFLAADMRDSSLWRDWYNLLPRGKGAKIRFEIISLRIFFSRSVKLLVDWILIEERKQLKLCYLHLKIRLVSFEIHFRFLKRGKFGDLFLKFYMYGFLKCISSAIWRIGTYIVRKFPAIADYLRYKLNSSKVSGAFWAYYFKRYNIGYSGGILVQRRITSSFSWNLRISPSQDVAIGGNVGDRPQRVRSLRGGLCLGPQVLSLSYPPFSFSLLPFYLIPIN